MQGHSKAISCLKFSPDGNILATGSADKTVRIWNATDGKAEKVIGGHKLGISDLSWTNDSRFIGTCSDDKSLKIFDVTAVSFFICKFLLLTLPNFRENVSKLYAVIQIMYFVVPSIRKEVWLLVDHLMKPLGYGMSEPGLASRLYPRMRIPSLQWASIEMELSFVPAVTMAWFEFGILPMDSVLKHLLVSIWIVDSN